LIAKTCVYSLSSWYKFGDVPSGIIKCNANYFFINVSFFDVLLNNRIGWKDIHTDRRDTSVLHA